MEHSMVQANRRILSFAAAAVFAVLLTSSVISIRQPVGDDSTFQSLRYVVCHSINGAGGDSGPALDIDPSVRKIDVFGFAARMWKGAEEMVALQVMEVGFTIELNGQQLAHLAHFLHDYEAQKTFGDEDIPAIVRQLLEAEKRRKELDL
jgi:hypothetical protein